jgi:phosphoribosylaminoimidazole-succinocarboxamide synthase
MHDKIQNALGNTIDTVECPQALSQYHGKVRETFLLPDNKRAIVVSDRISAFDFVLGTVPFKGQVLNQIALWWFRKLDGVVPHHIISSPDPNISLVKNVTPLPIEIIVRGYLTGSTKTSSWYAYQNLDRMICGLEMPAGMVKNQQFEELMITPTTKPETGHDEAISREEIIEQGLVDEDMYKKVEQYALTMFRLGQKEAQKKGMILVDTKYEMGIDADGNLLIIDEVHTPDSSRYWMADEYYFDEAKNEYHTKSLDKEFVRKKLVEKGYDVNDVETNPKEYLTDDIRAEASLRYIQLYEQMTGEQFEFPDTSHNRTETIEKTLRNLV